MQTTLKYPKLDLPSRLWTVLILSLILLPILLGGLLARSLYNPMAASSKPSPSSIDARVGGALVHTAGSFEFTVAHDGTLGGIFLSSRIDDGPYGDLPGFEFPKNSFLEYLFGGSLWVGAIVGNDTLVSVGADGWASDETMIPDPENPGVRIVSGVADENFEAIYHDSLPPIWNVPNTPGALGITVKQLSMAWNREPNNDFAVIEYQITNSRTADTLKDMFMGLYVDGDIGHRTMVSTDGFTDDITGFDSENNIAYIADNDGQPVVYSNPDTMWTEMSTRAVLGAKILDIRHSETTTLKPPSFNWWISNGIAALDFGPRMSGTAEDPFRDFGGFLGTPEGAENKYYILSHPEIDYDQLFASVDHTPLWLPPGDPSFADGFDARFLISQGGISLAPGDSLVFVVAIAIGDNYHVNPTDFADFFDPLQPEVFSSKLDLTDLQRNIAAAESLYVSGYNVQVVYPPPRPTLDDKLSPEPLMSWLFSGNPSVEGYDVYLAKAPDSAVLCHHALVDTPQFLPENMIASVTSDTFRLSGLEDGQWYAAGVAVHPLPDSVAPISEPVVFQYGVPHAPTWDSSMFLNEDQLKNNYVSKGEDVPLRWKSQDTDIDYFNVYRSKELYPNPWPLNLIGIGNCLLEDTPGYEIVCSTRNSDSVLICLTSRIVHEVVSGQSLSYVDAPKVSSKYRYGITAVDSVGNESPMTSIIRAYTYPSNRDQLMVGITDSLRTGGPNLSMTKDIFHFYRDLLAPYDPDYRFRTRIRGEKRRWPPTYEEIAKYETVIVDGSGRYRGLILGSSSIRLDYENWLVDYVRTGGRIVDVGINFAWNRSDADPPQLVLSDYTLPKAGHLSTGRDIFGLDSILMIPYPTGDSALDSVNQFYRPMGAKAETGIGFPDLLYNHSGFYTTPQELTTGPIPYKGVMFPREDNTEILYTWVGGRVIKSDFEGLPIGVKYTPETHTAYVLISNPWEWEPQQAQDFFAKILGDFQTDVTDDDEEPTLPKTFALAQNYPNPFNPTTRISYSVPSRAQVTLRVYNILGQRVRTLVDEVLEAGDHVVTWDASEFASGMYFYKLSAGATRLSRKMVLLK
jgi:Secretion system C-terminal sorting domain